MERLDKFLTVQGFFESRNRALEAIESGLVEVDGKVAVKGSIKVHSQSSIRIKEAKFYVSRAARKLETFLDAHPVALKGRRALDIGSSTGGFAQVLLERGVASLVCVDVGSDQLHPTIRSDARVDVYEKTDIRDFDAKDAFDVITCDVSFISVLKIVDAIDRLCSEEGDIIILFKPQFEVGRSVKRNAKGVVTDMLAIQKSQRFFEDALFKRQWKKINCTPSLTAGKEGNVEWVYHYKKLKRL